LFFSLKNNFLKFFRKSKKSSTKKYFINWRCKQNNKY